MSDQVFVFNLLVLLIIEPPIIFTQFQNGLAAVFIGQIIYFVIGTAKDASIGPSPIIAVITGEFNAHHNQLYRFADATYTTLLSFMIGIILTVWGVVQLSYLYNLFSIPVVSGFITAAGFAVPCSQLRNFLGLPFNPMVPPGVLVKQVKNVFDNWHSIKPLDLAFGVPSITYIVLIQRLPIFVNIIIVKVLKNEGKLVAFLKHPITQQIIVIIAASKIFILFRLTIKTKRFFFNSQERSCFHSYHPHIVIPSNSLPT